jgi:hypothetical protein
VLFGCCHPVSAAITWTSQERWAGYGTYHEVTASGIAAGMHSNYTPATPQYSASGFGSFTAPVGTLSFTSNIDTTANLVTARGTSTISPTPTIVGIQFVTYPYDAAHFTTTFNLTETTPYQFTKLQPTLLGSRGVQLSGPGNQVITFPSLTTTPVTGTLSPGDWTLQAFADAALNDGITHSAESYNFTFALVPEPGAAVTLCAAAVGAMGLRARRKPTN